MLLLIVTLATSTEDMCKTFKKKKSANFMAQEALGPSYFENSYIPVMPLFLHMKKTMP